MEVKDLMVGDIVRVNKDVCIKKGTIVKVTAIDAQDSLVNFNLKGSTHCVNINDEFENGGVWVAYLEPVPLTMEIINKQGWEFHRHSWELDSCEGYITDDIDYKGEHTGIFSFDIMGEEDLLLVKTIKYVHQLQHVLRLLEIDKEIVL